MILFTRCGGFLSPISIPICISICGIIVSPHYCCRVINWVRWAASFEDDGFEIYKATNKIYVENKVLYDIIIGGPD